MIVYNGSNFKVSPTIYVDYLNEHRLVYLTYNINDMNGNLISQGDYSIT